ncbi:MAG: DUF4407 domain-containing protein [Bacteroidetes bacterium]|nr:DUF4407 domain-containing protein [Bacteroidota bacterium]
MTKLFNRISSFITGADYQRLRLESGWSLQKVSLLGMIVLLPTLIWGLSTYFLVHHVLGGSLKTGLFAALVASVVVFILERSIVMSETDSKRSERWIKTFRWILGFVVALLGAFAIDSVVFDHDIRLQLDRMKQHEAHEARLVAATAQSDALELLQQRTETARVEWMKALDVARREAEGTSGSGIKGVHSITRLKMQIAEQLEQDYLRALGEYTQAKSLTEKAMHEKEELALARFDNPGLLLRIEALHQLVFENRFALVAYLMFFLLMFIIEIMPVTLKFNLPESSYDYTSRLEDQMRRRNLNTMLMNNLPGESQFSGRIHTRNGMPAPKSQARFA